MNSIHRVGLAVSGFAAVLTVGGAFVIQGYVAAQHGTPTSLPSANTDSLMATDAPTATPTLAPQIVYVLPQPTPPVITIKKQAPPAVVQPAATPPVIHITVTASPGHGDDGGGDD